MNVLEYFYSILPSHDKKWRIVYEHFNIFVKGQCSFDELTVDFCNKFREYLGTTTRIKSNRLKLSRNSAAGYWSTFRAFLAIAFKEDYLKENVNDYLDKIETQETKREYLTQEELQKLADSHCDYHVLKSASLFSCLTGLRLSDILQLEWHHIQNYPAENASASRQKKPTPRLPSPSVTRRSNSAALHQKAKSSKASQGSSSTDG